MLRADLFSCRGLDTLFRGRLGRPFDVPSIVYAYRFFDFFAKGFLSPGSSVIGIGAMSGIISHHAPRSFPKLGGSFAAKLAAMPHSNNVSKRLLNI